MRGFVRIVIYGIFGIIALVMESCDWFDSKRINVGVILNDEITEHYADVYLFNANGKQEARSRWDSASGKLAYIWDSVDQGPYTIVYDSPYYDRKETNIKVFSDTIIKLQLGLKEISEVDSLTISELKNARDIKVILFTEGCWASYRELVEFRRGSAENSSVFISKENAREGSYQRKVNTTDDTESLFLSKLDSFQLATQKEGVEFSSTFRNIYILADGKVVKYFRVGLFGNSFFDDLKRICAFKENAC